MRGARLTIFVLGLALSSSSFAYAQLAPTPNKAPRTPVKSASLPSDKTPALPVSRLLAGKASVLDTEKLKLDGTDLRLFGVVPPHMSAPLGPQARAVLDSLAEGDVTCEIKDREREGTYLALCKNGAGNDFGLELLRRGLAVAARGTLRPTSLAEPYLAAERAAQTQRIGLWETKAPPALSDESIAKATAQTDAAKKELDRLLAEKKELDKKTHSLKSELAAAKEIAVSLESMQDARDSLAPLAPPSLPEALISPGQTIQSVSVVTPPAAPLAENQTPWLERNQVFATGLVGLASAFVIAGAFVFSRARSSKNDLRALAAALRGELLAARAIAKARIAKWSEESLDPQAAAWPRIRIIVFQALVGKIGMLGAELARQVASIYGQTSDFASYYGTNGTHNDLSSKQQALRTLLDHIEEVLPRLEHIENSGSLPAPFEKAHIKTPLLARMPARKRKESLAAPIDNGGTSVAVIAAQNQAVKPADSKKEAATRLAEIKAELMKDTPYRALPKTQTACEFMRDKTHAALECFSVFLARTSLRTQNVKTAVLAWLTQPEERPIEPNPVPDYANLTEEELEALAESYFNEEFHPIRKRAR